MDKKPKRITSVNIRYFPNQKNPDDPLQTTVVLVEGDIGDYAAYCGHGDPDWVADYGAKISFEEACCHFPVGLIQELYRI